MASAHTKALRQAEGQTRSASLGLAGLLSRPNAGITMAVRAVHG